MKYKSLIVLIALINFLCVSCSNHKEKKKEIVPIPVVITTPLIKDITLYLETIGELNPSVHVDIRPQAQGLLQEILVKEGQWVQKDTPLFIIDQKKYQIKVQEAEAQLAIDVSQYKAIQKKLVRFNSLAKKDLMAQTEWDDLEMQAEKSQSTVDLDTARLNSAKLELERCTLRSPVEGRIGKIHVHPGTLIDFGYTTPLTTIAKLHPLIIEFSITEKEFLNFPKEELKFEIYSICSSDECKEGKITYIDNHFDSKTGLLQMKGRVDNKDFSSLPGQSVRIKIPVTLINKALLIPQKSIRYNQTGPYVYVIQEDSKAHIQQIELGTEYGDYQRVIKGLQEDQKIVLDGHLRLTPDALVVIQP